MSLRWALDALSWSPSVEELAFALACVQDEERVRIGRFVFLRDAKLALAGVCCGNAACYGPAWRCVGAFL